MLLLVRIRYLCDREWLGRDIVVWYYAMHSILLVGQYSFHIIVYYFIIENISKRCHAQTNCLLNHPNSNESHLFIVLTICNSGMWWNVEYRTNP